MLGLSTAWQSGGRTPVMTQSLLRACCPVVLHALAGDGQAKYVRTLASACRERG